LLKAALNDEYISKLLENNWNKPSGASGDVPEPTGAAIMLFLSVSGLSLRRARRRRLPTSRQRR
jgi:hypothetical protein